MTHADLRARARHPEVSVRITVAQDPRCPPELLAELAYDPDSRVVSEVALNPNTPESTLVMLAKYPLDVVRGNVAENPNCPHAAYKILAKDPEKWVREKVARRAPYIDVLCEIARNDDWWVRKNILSNLNAPPLIIAAVVSKAFWGAGEKLYDVVRLLKLKEEKRKEILTILAFVR
ncbi:MAG: hypothetical protein NZ992_00025 [Candidatus Korarchaeum sp.]|nr:hypothetical protein [Candidatus Korarchaeum sp.]